MNDEHLFGGKLVYPGLDHCGYRMPDGSLEWRPTPGYVPPLKIPRIRRKKTEVAPGQSSLWDDMA